MQSVRSVGYCADLFATRRAGRIKVLVHDGVGVWLAASCLHQGDFTGQEPDMARKLN